MTNEEEKHILDGMDGACARLSLDIRNLERKLEEAQEKTHTYREQSIEDRATILAQLQKNAEDHDHIAEALLQINNAIYGNGTPGLKSIAQSNEARIKTLEDCQAEVKADKKDLSNRWRNLFFAAIGTIITLIITWGMGALGLVGK